MYLDLKRNIVSSYLPQKNWSPFWSDVFQFSEVFHMLIAQFECIFLLPIHFSESTMTLGF